MSAPAPRRLRDQRGFTLVELLVATADRRRRAARRRSRSSTRALHAQTRVDDRTEAIARGRTAMEQIVQQLRSQVCLGPGYPAIAYGDNSHDHVLRRPRRHDVRAAAARPHVRERHAHRARLHRHARPAARRRSRSPSTPVAHARDPRATACNLQQGGATVPFFTLLLVRPANTRSARRDLLATPLSANDARASCRSPSASRRSAARAAARTITAEPFTANVFVRTADPTDPDHSPALHLMAGRIAHATGVARRASR